MVVLNYIQYKIILHYRLYYLDIHYNYYHMYLFNNKSLLNLALFLFYKDINILKSRLEGLDYETVEVFNSNGFINIYVCLNLYSELF